MRRITFAVVTPLLVVLLAHSTALAVNPHFIRATASGSDESGNLIVSFKSAGLGDTVATTVTASANATAVYACQNNGGNFPSDPKKQEVSGPNAGTEAIPGTFSRTCFDIEHVARGRSP